MTKMISLLIRISLALLVLNYLLTPCTAFRSYGSRGYSSGKYENKGPSKSKTLAGTSSGLPTQNATRRGLGISAWGIVAVAVTLILAGTGLYYFSICYPILCRKERKYDIIEMPNA